MSAGTFTPRPGAAPLAAQVAAQTRMEVRLLLRNGEQVLLALVIPLLVLVGGVVVGRRVDALPGVDALVPGVLGLAVLSTAFTSLAIATGFERRYGVLKWLGSSPLPRSGLLAGKAGALLVVEALQVVVVAAAGLALGWRPALSPAALGSALLAVLLGTAAFAALGLALAGALRAEATLAAANLVYLLLAAAGAVVVPAASYGAFGPALALLPSGALGEALRAALGDGAASPVALVVLLGWTGAGTLLAARTFRWE